MCVEYPNELLSPATYIINLDDDSIFHSFKTFLPLDFIDIDDRPSSQSFIIQLGV